jgi:phosphohistidine phosphatase
MYKTLLLTRHAHAEWNSGLQTDYERKLTQEGEAAATAMGAKLADKKIVVDLIIASTAHRAAQTARLIATALGYPHNEIQWQEHLYNCRAQDFETIVAFDQLADNIQTVMIVAHNPGITEYANEKTAGLYLAAMPPCGIVALNLPLQHWRNVPETIGTLSFFEYPKNQ